MEREVFNVSASAVQPANLATRNLWLETCAKRRACSCTLRNVSSNEIHVSRGCWLMLLTHQGGRCEVARDAIAGTTHGDPFLQSLTFTML